MKGLLQISLGILAAVGGFVDAGAQAAVTAWIRDGVELDAIFAGDDDASVGVLLALRQARRRVPEEIAVVGFDDQISEARPRRQADLGRIGRGLVRLAQQLFVCR